jgi:hypothetical protein
MKQIEAKMCKQEKMLGTQIFSRYDQDWIILSKILAATQGAVHKCADFFYGMSQITIYY